MSHFAIGKMLRMILHKTGWTQKYLARHVLDLDDRHFYNLLHDVGSKRRGIPKGYKRIVEVFLEHFNCPIPPHLRPIFGEVEEIAHLRRTRSLNNDALADKIAQWLLALEFLSVSTNATPDERFVIGMLQGHVGFAAACEVRVDADDPRAHLFRPALVGKHLALAIKGFQSARDALDINKMPEPTRSNYRRLWSLAIANLGAAMFMAWRKGLVPSVTEELVRKHFRAAVKVEPGAQRSAPSPRLADSSVEQALEHLYSLDPGDARIAFNAVCWFSVLEDAAGCCLWFNRLVKADKDFADVTRKHQWMSKSMSDDPDFRFLLTIVMSNNKLAQAS
jgi:hypothetical protein